MIEFNEIISAIKIIATTAIIFVWIARYDNIKKEFQYYNYPSWFRDLVGILKISFCIMLHSSETSVLYFGSIGIQLGGIGGIAPQRKKELAKLITKAMIGGALASWLTASVAGILI